MANSRIHLALDGGIAPERLSRADAAEYRRMQDACAAALAPLDAAPAIDLAPAVMRRILERGQDRIGDRGTNGSAVPRRSALAAAGAWLWAPRPVAIRLRPAFALGLAAALAAVVALWSPHPRAEIVLPALAMQPSAVSPARMLVEFRLGAPGAREVALVGDFSAWKPEHRMHEIAPGVWAVSVALEAGVYDYAFTVDGNTIRLDPLAPRVADGFGGHSSRVTVLQPDRQS